jgi:predicted benzoate:H+ symporter BenE
MLAQAVRGNGFLGGEWSLGDIEYLLISSFLPTRILEFVMLEGSAIALILGTVAMITCHFAFERARWIVPANLWVALRRLKQ